MLNVISERTSVTLLHSPYYTLVVFCSHSRSGHLEQMRVRGKLRHVNEPTTYLIAQAMVGKDEQ